MSARLGIVLLFFVACGSPGLHVGEVPSPAAPGSAEPSIELGADGRIYLSWLEPYQEGHALRFAKWENGRWSAPRIVAHGTDWVANWADFPTITALDDGTLAAVWLTKNAGAPYAYGAALAFSHDGGTRWSAALTPHDASPTEHGFVSQVGLPGGRLAMIWLDGRETGGDPEHPTGPMTLRGALFGPSGVKEREDLIDRRVCDCCQTSLARLADGALLAAYRDRSDREIRDVSVVRFDGSRWEKSASVHDDGWEIAGCPVNGPSIASIGPVVAVAWFTGAGAPPRKRVMIAFSRDGGRRFGPPAEVSATEPEGRVDVVFLDQDSVLVTWIEGGAAPCILARRVDADGSMDEPLTIATSSNERAAGFPRMAAVGGVVLVAWTEPAKPTRVRTALIEMR